MADQDYSQYAEYSQDNGDQCYDYCEDENIGYGGSEDPNVATDLTNTVTMAAGAKDDDDKKLFIGGLGWGTTQDDLQNHFSKYGGIVQVTIKTNPATGKPRGFAFIQFSCKESVERVLISGPHLINGTTVEAKRVKARRSGYNKIFVGGLDPDLPESEIRAYFERFGKIEGIELPYDKVRNQRKQFCFVAFESEDVVEQICKQPRQRIGGRDCDVKKATRRQAGRASGSAASGWGAGYSYDYGVSGRRRGRGRGRGATTYSQQAGTDYSGHSNQYNYSSYNYTPSYSTQGYNQSYPGYGTYTHSGWRWMNTPSDGELLDVVTHYST